jgi:ABC-type proline/glycine betaine transport system ATPase subunit
VNKNIFEYAADKTVIFISHRLSTTRFVDEIYMFESGRIVEQGIHEELMALNGKYAAMYHAQADKYRLSPVSAEEYYFFVSILFQRNTLSISQCIQSLGKIAAVKPSLCEKISSKLISYDITAVKETMRKSILTDILNVLLIIRQEHRTKETETFISNALFGDILDKKTKKQIEALLHDR